MLYNTATLVGPTSRTPSGHGRVVAMPQSPHPASPEAGPGQRAEALVAGIFAEAGWKVRHNPAHDASGRRPDMVVRRGAFAYAVEVKAAPEGRGDRLVPLWSQACLQASQAAGLNKEPLAIVVAPRIPRRVADQVLQFAAEYAPAVAAGVVDFAGRRAFAGKRLGDLNADGSRSPGKAHAVAAQANRFSDANQWMLKILLAPEVPDRLLAAPRARYRNAPELARAAGVSVMSAHRFLRQLRHDGFLDESAGRLQLVRRRELFHRWQSAVALHPGREMAVRALISGSASREMHRLMARGRACFALFAAADALRLGFVKGVPPCLYVPRLDHALAASSQHVVPAAHGEAPDFILREASAPRSIFGGAVDVADDPARGRARSRAGGRACDVLQLWLDVSAHPARGAEQADLIRKRVLAPLFDGDGHE